VYPIVTIEDSTGFRTYGQGRVGVHGSDTDTTGGASTSLSGGIQTLIFPRKDHKVVFQISFNAGGNLGNLNADSASGIVLPESDRFDFTAGVEWRLFSYARDIDRSKGGAGNQNKARRDSIRKAADTAGGWFALVGRALYLQGDVVARSAVETIKESVDFVGYEVGGSYSITGRVAAERFKFTIGGGLKWLNVADNSIETLQRVVPEIDETSDVFFGPVARFAVIRGSSYFEFTATNLKPSSGDEIPGLSGSSYKMTMGFLALN
jgi:hypothetical protein